MADEGTVNSLHGVAKWTVQITSNVFLMVAVNVVFFLPHPRVYVPYFYIVFLLILGNIAAKCHFTTCTLIKMIVYIGSFGSYKVNVKLRLFFSKQKLNIPGL